MATRVVRDSCEKTLPDLVSPQPIHHHLMELVTALEMALGRPDASLVFVTLGKSWFTVIQIRSGAQSAQRKILTSTIQLFMNTLERSGPDYSLFMRG